MDAAKQRMVCYARKTIESLTLVAEKCITDERVQVGAGEIITRHINLIYNEMFQQMDQVKTLDEKITRWFEVFFLSS